LSGATGDFQCVPGRREDAHPPTFHMLRGADRDCVDLRQATATLRRKAPFRAINSRRFACNASRYTFASNGYARREHGVSLIFINA